MKLLFLKNIGKSKLNLKDDVTFEAELAKYHNKKIELHNEEETNAVYEALNKEFRVSDVKKTQRNVLQNHHLLHLHYSRKHLQS